MSSGSHIQVFVSSEDHTLVESHFFRSHIYDHVSDSTVTVSDILTETESLVSTEQGSESEPSTGRGSNGGLGKWEGVKKSRKLLVRRNAAQNLSQWDNQSGIQSNSQHGSNSQSEAVTLSHSVDQSPSEVVTLSHTESEAPSLSQISELKAGSQPTIQTEAKPMTNSWSMSQSAIPDTSQGSEQDTSQSTIQDTSQGSEQGNSQSTEQGKSQGSEQGTSQGTIHDTSRGTAQNLVQSSVQHISQVSVLGSSSQTLTDLELVSLTDEGSPGGLLPAENDIDMCTITTQPDIATGSILHMLYTFLNI